MRCPRRPEAQALKFHLIRPPVLVGEGKRLFLDSEGLLLQCCRLFNQVHRLFRQAFRAAIEDAFGEKLEQSIANAIEKALPDQCKK